MTDFRNPESPADEQSAPLPPERERGRRSFWGLLLAAPRRLVSRFGLLVLLAAAVMGLLYLASQGKGFVKQTELEEEKARLESEIETLQDENRLLRERLARLSEDPAFVEDEARKKLGLIRSGETVYRLSEEPDLADGPAPSPQ